MLSDIKKKIHFTFIKENDQLFTLYINIYILFIKVFAAFKWEDENRITGEITCTLVFKL